MQNEEVKVTEDGVGAFVNLPMTRPSGKVRIKKRSFFAQYGEPVASRQTALTQTCYVEWQIGYDLLATDENRDKTSLSDKKFINYKGEKKFAYELSEMVLRAYERGLLDSVSIRNCYAAIEKVSEEDTFESTASITRTNPREKCINGLPFYEMEVAYPLFVHRFGQYEILAEIMIREKQRAIGSQAMLYVCLPITSLEFTRNALGRTLDSHECAKWRLGKNEAELGLELFRVFGMLSAKHRHDVMAILRMLFQDVLA